MNRKPAKPREPIEPPKSITIILRIDPATLARLDKIANERGESRSQCVRSLIDLWD